MKKKVFLVFMLVGCMLIAACANENNNNNNNNNSNNNDNNNSTNEIVEREVWTADEVKSLFADLSQCLTKQTVQDAALKYDANGRLRTDLIIQNDSDSYVENFNMTYRFANGDTMTLVPTHDSWEIQPGQIYTIMSLAPEGMTLDEYHNPKPFLNSVDVIQEDGSRINITCNTDTGEYKINGKNVEELVGQPKNI